MSVGARLCDGLYSRPQLYSFRYSGCFHFFSDFVELLYVVALQISSGARVLKQQQNYKKLI